MALGLGSSATLSIVVKARDEATRTLDQISRTTQDMNRQMRWAGIAMIGMGLAITGMMALAVKAAAEEEAGIENLRVAMRNVGLDYDAVSKSLEATIDAQQQKTAVSDSEQRDSLAMLITATGDLNEASKLNALAMDVARGVGVDLATADRMLMYAREGNIGMLRRYGIQIEDNASGEQALAVLQARFAGQAEAYGNTLAGQAEILKNNMDDVREAIGTCLMVAVRPFLADLSKMAMWFKNLDPFWQKLIAYGAGATGVFLTLGGAFLMFVSMIPNLIRGLAMLNLANLRNAASAAVAAVAGAARAVAGVPVVGPFLVAGAVAAMLAALGYGISKAKSLFTGLEKGGIVIGGGGFVVGERGPELAYLPRGAAVTPLSSLATTNISNQFYIRQIVIREEADIRKVAQALEELQARKNRGLGL